MKRFVIAILALLGLVAQAAPVSARLGGMEAAQHGVVLGQNVQGQKLVVQRAVRQAGYVRPERREVANIAVQTVTFAAVPVATVHIGIDRARQ
ncbi:MAG: hypothetical protein ABIU18_05750 [Novosphingobium sp.]